MLNEIFWSRAGNPQCLSGLKVGLILNFKRAELEWKRVILEENCEWTQMNANSEAQRYRRQIAFQTRDYPASSAFATAAMARARFCIAMPPGWKMVFPVKAAMSSATEIFKRSTGLLRRYYREL